MSVGETKEPLSSTSARHCQGAAAAGAGRIRVAFCLGSLGIGGTELNAIRTAERLDRSRFELSAIVLQGSGPLKERLIATGVRVHALPIPNLYGPAALRQGLRLAMLLRESNIDIFHAHDIYSNIFGAPWARLAGVQVIASRRWWARAPKRGQMLANRLAYRFAHRVLANSPRVGELLCATEGVSAERVAVVANFVDEAAFQPPSAEERSALLRELGVSPGTPIVGIVANLRPVKDHASLLRAVALLRSRWPNLALILVGDGECRAPLQELARELNIDGQVFFAGRRPHHPNLHHLFDISVLCSRSEALSNSILEAMAAGNPVVATDVGASGDAVLDRTTGLLVPPSDPPRMGAALERLLSDPKLAQSMGAAGRERAQVHYSAAAALSSLEHTYCELWGRRRAPDEQRTQSAYDTRVLSS